jgi:hypothetical protein
MDVQAVDKEIQVKGVVTTLQQYLHSKNMALIMEKIINIIVENYLAMCQ